MATVDTATVTLTVNGREVTVPKGFSVVEAAAEAGIRLQGVGPRRDHVRAPRGGLTFGYGVVTEQHIEPAVVRLAAVFAHVRRGST